MENAKAKSRKVANLEAQLAPKLLELLRASRDEDAAQVERERERQEQKAEDEKISSACMQNRGISACRSAFL